MTIQIMTEDVAPTSLSESNWYPVLRYCTFKTCKNNTIRCEMLMKVIVNLKAPGQFVNRPGSEDVYSAADSSVKGDLEILLLIQKE